jgi:hypothetical protein
MMKYFRNIFYAAAILYLSGQVNSVIAAGALGSPEVATPPNGDNSNHVADTAFVAGAISNLSGGGCGGPSANCAFDTIIPTNALQTRLNLGLANVVSVEDPANGTVFGDAQQAFFPMTWGTSSGAVSITAGATFTDTATAVLSAPRSITFASAHCTNAMLGQPITISSGGPDNGVYSGVIIACSTLTRPSVGMMVSPPLGAALPTSTVTVTWGAQFSNVDVGKEACWTLQFGSPFCSQITTVTASNAFTVASNPSAASAAATGNTKFWWGHCDDTAVTTAARRAIALYNTNIGQGFPHPYLLVQKNHMLCGTVDTTAIYAVDPIGSGAWYPTPDISYAGVNGTINSFDRPVVPIDARVPEPPERTAEGPNQFRQFGACRPNCTVMIVGDSIMGPEDNGASDLFSPAGLVTNRIVQDNAGKGDGITVDQCGIGGAVWANLDGFPNTTAPPCVTNTTTPWLGNAANPGFGFNIQPDVIYYGMQNNTTGTQNLPHLINVFATLATWPKVPDAIMGTNHAIAPGGPTGGAQDNAFSVNAAGIDRGYALLYGLPLLDIDRVTHREHDGYDPLSMAYVRSFDAPSMISQGLFSFKQQIEGFDLTWTGTTGGSTYWSTYGNAIGWNVNSNQLGGDSFVWVSRNPSTGVIGIQCDISSETTKADYPGLACRDPATGKPPVTPTLLSNITISSSSPTTLTSSLPLFTAADTGKTFTIPGAGATITPGAFNAYTLPLITTVTFVSPTQLTLITPASTFLSANNQVVERGNPVIASQFVDNASSEDIEFNVMGNRLVIYWQGEYQIIYDGPIMRYGDPFIPIMISASGTGTLTLGLDQINGLPQYFTARRILNRRSYTEEEMSGSENDLVSYAIGGGEGNHPSATFTMRTWEAALSANNWAMAPDGLRKAWNITTNSRLVTIPSGSAITAVYLNEVAGNAVTGGINIGTTSGASDIASAVPVAANGNITINGAALLKTQFGNNPQTLFVSAASSFNSAIINARVTFTPR